jgi:hypothetical protein
MALQQSLREPAPQSRADLTAAARRTGAVLCIAVASNCGATVRAAVAHTAEALSAFERVQWLVVECGSTDDTVAQLDTLRREWPGFAFESLGRLTLASIPITQRLKIGHARCLERLAADPRYRDVVHLVDVELGASLGYPARTPA